MGMALVRWMAWCWMAAVACLIGHGAACAAPPSSPVKTLPKAAPDRPTLLWITGEVTPPPRTELVRQQAEAQGFAVVHKDVPLRGPASPEGDEQRLWQAALAQAAIVWVDAPHASVAQRLSRWLEVPLKASRADVIWVTPESDAPPGSASERASRYLRAGGGANVGHAVKLAWASVHGRPLPDLPAPVVWPQGGLYHPDAPAGIADAQGMSAWLATQPGLREKPAVAVLVHRYHFVDGSTAWLDEWLRRFARKGLAAYAVFAPQVDAKGLAARLELPGPTPRLHPRVIVSHQLLSQGAALQSGLSRWGVPLLLTQPYRQGDEQAWLADESGLSQSDVPFYLAQPEGAGGFDPVMVTAHADKGRRIDLIDRQAQAVVDKAARLIALQDKPRREKQLVAMVYNYPAGASNFGASFLNVPRSLEQVSGALASEGYDTREVAEAQWISGLQPMLAAYYPEADLTALLEAGQAEALPLMDYLDWWKQQTAQVRQRIEAQWGRPEQSRYVVPWQGQRVFVIPRMRVGKLAVLPQPPREETLHKGQNAFMHRSKLPLSHHYMAVYLWARRADALIHFGTHGTQEWAPGKARGLDVLDDALLPLGDVPVIYPYIVDNLGEALTAKRRGRALMVSHRTPSFSPAGFEARMAHMHEVMHEWETVDAGPTKVALERQLTQQFVEHHLHQDLGWTQEAILANFAGFLELLHPYLDALAQSSQPQGLAVFGRVPDAAQRRQTILQILRKPLIEALGEDIDEAFLIHYEAVAKARPARWLEVALRDADEASRLDLRPPLPEGPVPNRAARKPIDQKALHALALRAQHLEKLLSTEGEMPGLLRALDGRFIEAAYGGDPVRNPESLPTGRNLTGLDPSRLPTRQAYEVAQGLFHDWLKQYMADHGGEVPKRLVLSLWAGETLRHQGIMEAQALVALGVKPVWDETGRPVRLTLVPAAELNRPRVDVLLSITGSYRDQFPALMALIDQGVRLAADDAEAGQAVRGNTTQVLAALRGKGVGEAQARQLAQARVFGNAVGDYGTGLSEAVQSDGVQRDDARLGEMFLARMSQAYVDGRPAPNLGRREMAAALGAHLAQSQAALMSRSSHLYAMATSDDPFQYLGGLSAAARSAGRREGLALYVSQLQDTSEAATESASRVIALEMQSRYLHPGWMKAQQQEGYAGTLQVLKAVQYTLGWQVTAPGTVRPDQWQSLHDVIVKDKHGLGTPQWLRTHPQAYAQSVARLIQAQRMGYWEPDQQTKQDLATLYTELTREAPLRDELAPVKQWVQAQLQPQDDIGLQVQSPDIAARQYTPSRAQTPAPPAAREEPLALPPPPMGILLERQPDAPMRDEAADAGMMMSRAIVWLLIIALAIAGMARQARARVRLLPAPA